MKLYVKEKFFSIPAKFSVFDEEQTDHYRVEGELFSLVRKLHIFDPSGTEVAMVRGHWSFLPRFTVEVHGAAVAEIRKRFTWLRPSYYVDGKNWEVSGDFFGHDYAITENGRQIASVRKHWFSWGDSYEMDIASRTDEITAVAVILAIDTVMDSQANSSAAASSSN